MAMKLTPSGFVVTEGVRGGALLAFPDSVLRGIGQVLLQDNSYAGLLFLLGIFVNSPLFGMAALLGAVASTATAMLLGARRELLRAGMFGFNGVLVAIALLYFLTPNPLTWGCVVLAAAASSVLMAALLELFRGWRLPVLTAPFVLTALCFFLATARFGRLQSTQLLPTAGLPSAATVEGVVDAGTLWEGTLNGVAQIFFQQNPLSGGLFLLGLLLGSRLACLLALGGALAGLLVGWGMGAAEPALRAGGYGFNSALVAVALGGVFFARSGAAMAYAGLAAILAAFAHAALSAALEPLGMPAMTSSFVLVTWLCVLAGRGFARLRAAPG